MVARRGHGDAAVLQFHAPRWSCSSDAPSDNRSGSRPPSRSSLRSSRDALDLDRRLRRGRRHERAGRRRGAAPPRSTGPSLRPAAGARVPAAILSSSGRVSSSSRRRRSSPAGASSPGRGGVALLSALFSMSWYGPRSQPLPHRCGSSFATRCVSVVRIILDEKF